MESGRLFRKHRPFLSQGKLKPMLLGVPTEEAVEGEEDDEGD
jgi:hypothetical protein